MFAWMKGIANFDKTFCWSFIGTIIGILGIAIGFYFYIASYRSPDLVYELVSSTNIVDIKEDTPKLDILYGGHRITDSGNILKVIIVRIVNSGNEALRKNDYTEEDPLGISVTAGEIIETPEVIEASSEYISKSIKPQLVNKTKAIFNPVMLRPKDFIVIKVLVIHKSEDKVEIIPTGLLANVLKIAVKKLGDINSATKPTYNITAWEILGGALVALIASLYGFTFFAIRKSRKRTFDVVNFIKCNDPASKKKARIISEYLAKTDCRDDPLIRILVEDFINLGISSILKTCSMISSLKDINNLTDNQIRWLCRRQIIVKDDDKGSYKINRNAVKLYEEFSSFARDHYYQRS